jgi:GT2 family glycosyltransferase
VDPLVSVVIPCFNQARTIQMCVNSVLGQTYRSIEIIVVDDGSADSSAAIAESTGVTVLRMAGNRGPSAARNLGAGQARGEILFFLDADVALEPGSVAAAVVALRSAPRLGAICGVLHPDSLVSQTLVARYRAQQMYHWWLAHEGPITGLHTALCAMRAEVFRATGPFDPALRHTEAPEYGRRLRRRFEVRSTAAIAGTHDHDATLRILLPKVFRRARASAIEWQDGEVPSGAGSRVLASGLSLLAALALPLPLLVGVAGAAVPALLVLAALGLESRTYRRVVAGSGLWFGLRFAAVHLIYQLTSAAGAAAGSGQRLLSRHARPVGAVALSAAIAIALLLSLRWFSGGTDVTSLPGGDLLIYRGAVRAMLDGGSLYDFARGGYPFVYPPFAALPLAPLAWLTPATGFLWWTVVAVLSLMGSLWLLLGALGVTQLPRRRRLLVGATLVALPLSPVLATLALGNVNTVVMFLVLADLLWLPRRYRGVLIGLAAGFKLTPLIFVPYLFLTGRVRAGLTAVASFVGTVVLGFLVLPGDSLTFWSGAFLDSSRATPPFEQTLGSSIRGLWVSLSPAAPVGGWLALSLAVGALGMGVAVRASRRGEELVGILACAVTGLLVSPITWYSHWVWCVPALALVAARTGVRARPVLLVGLWLVFAAHLPWWALYRLGGAEVSTRAWIGFTDLLYLLTGVALLGLAAAWSRHAGPVRRLSTAVAR